MKTQNLFSVLLLVCIAQSLFLIYLSSSIKNLEIKVDTLSTNYLNHQTSEMERLVFLSKQNKKGKRLSKIRKVVREELALFDASKTGSDYSQFSHEEIQPNKSQP